MRYREVKRALLKAGWSEVRQKGSHHQFAHPDKNYVVTVPEHAGQEISIGVLKNIKEGTGLSLCR